MSAECGAVRSGEGKCQHQTALGLCAKHVASVCVELTAARSGIIGQSDPRVHPANLHRLAEKIAASERVALAVQNVAIRGYGPAARVCAIAFDDGSTHVVDLLPNDAGAELEPLLAALCRVQIVGFELKDAFVGLAPRLPTEPRVGCDIALLVRALQAGERDVPHTMAGAQREWLGRSTAARPKELVWTGHITRIHAVDLASRVSDALVLADALLAECTERGLREVVELEQDLIGVSVAMQLRGLRVNSERFYAARGEVDAAIDAVRRSAERAELSGETNESEALAKELRGLRHLSESFVEPLARALRESPDSYVRGDVCQYGTVTGRFAVKNVPLQSMPRHAALRDCFEAEEGRTLVRADYSCFELRVLAGLTKDESLCELFQVGADAHREIAANLLAKPVHEVTEAERSRIKQVVFGICFDMQPRSISAAAHEVGIDLSEPDAARYRSQFLERHVGIACWRAALLSARSPEERTIMGRRRQFQGDDSDGARLAFPVQGSAADIVKCGLRRLYPLLAHLDAVVVMVWHDEVIVDAPESVATEVEQLLVRHLSEAAAQLFGQISFPVNVRTARSLGGASALRSKTGGASALKDSTSGRDKMDGPALHRFPAWAARERPGT